VMKPEPKIEITARIRKLPGDLLAFKVNVAVSL
jgi:hypothetical protein